MKAIICWILTCAAVLSPMTVAAQQQEKPSVRWVDFSITATALRDAADADIGTYGTPQHVCWIDALAYLASKYGGDFSKYQKKHLQSYCSLSAEERTEKQNGMKLFAYYQKAYTGVLRGVLGPYRIETYRDGDWEPGPLQYGIRVCHPIAKGYGYTHFDDFGASRAFGFKRQHLGHDLMGSTGTPIIATEGGVVEALGWNRYGGWRVGIRSFDGSRYYYYAHLRKGHPYCDLYEGKTVMAGEVIGYMGRTGYSDREDTDNIRQTHLHYGIQLIFPPAKKDDVNQIWIDLLEWTRFLDSYRIPVSRTPDGKESVSNRRIWVPDMGD